MSSSAASTIERAVENESVFRRVNEEIAATAAAGGDGAAATFVCECSDPSCHATIELTQVEYAWIRSHPTYFVVTAGHEQRPDERTARVVRYALAHTVVEKLGYAAALAAADRAAHPEPAR
jgi:hypothetical protein